MAEDESPLIGSEPTLVFSCALDQLYLGCAAGNVIKLSGPCEMRRAAERPQTSVYREAIVLDLFAYCTAVILLPTSVESPCSTVCMAASNWFEAIMPGTIGRTVPYAELRTCVS